MTSFGRSKLHTADPELYGRAVADMRQDKVCDLNICFGRRGIRHLIQRRIAALDDVIYLGYVYPDGVAAQDARHIAVYLNDHDVGIIRDAL